MPEFPPMDYTLLGPDVVRSELPLAAGTAATKTTTMPRVPITAVKEEDETKPQVPLTIYGTERDKVNCSFYLKVGACRHGDLCSRLHHKPLESRTVLLKNFYVNPVVDVRQADAFDRGSPDRGAGVGEPNEAEQTYFDDFYEEVFDECESKYGRVLDIIVCENIGEHMVGNVYVQFDRLGDAMRAVEDLNNRWFNGMPVFVEPSPVTDFKSARCRQHDVSYCQKGGFCNFLHIKNISAQLEKRLYGDRRREAEARPIKFEAGGARPRYYGPIKREREVSPVREARHHYRSVKREREMSPVREARYHHRSTKREREVSPVREARHHRSVKHEMSPVRETTRR